MSDVNSAAGASGATNVFMTQGSSNPEVVMFLAEMTRMTIEGNTIDAYYSGINTMNSEMTDMDDLLEQIDNEEAGCSGVNGTQTVSSTMAEELNEYGISANAGDHWNSTQWSDASESLEQQIDDVSTQSSESMDQMELVTNNYESDATTASDLISGMTTLLETIASNMKE